MTDSRNQAGVMIVAIDGPSGVGKSTVAQRVAEALGVPYLSTGAMYRAVAMKVLATGTDAEDRSAVETVARDIDLDLIPVGAKFEIRLDSAPSGRGAYSLEVSRVTSRISTYPGVRERMVALQREGALRQGAVLEGRDIGTRVFPETPFKFFLDAGPEIRAQRRWLQLGGAEKAEAQQSEVLREVLERDRRDSTRRESPLTRDSTYILIDTAELSVDQVVAAVVERVEKLRAGRNRPDLTAVADDT